MGMNREHKYRAYIKSEKKFKYFTLQEIYNIGSTYWENKWWDEIREFNEYTGLKDKNGKEIYEGDIIKNEHSWNKITQVIFGEFIADDTYYGCPCAFVTSDEDCNQLSSRIEIIGNIYENPELLEDKK